MESRYFCCVFRYLELKKIIYGRSRKTQDINDGVLQQKIEVEKWQFMPWPDVG